MNPRRPEVLITRLDPDMPIPSYARQGDAGADLASREDVVLEPGERRVVGTGIALAIPPGWAGFVHPRSGLAAREGLTIVNAPGTIDSGYRGEVLVCLLNTDRNRRVILHRGDLVAQLVFQQVGEASFVDVKELPTSERGSGGYGSTGGVSRWTDADESEYNFKETEQ